MSRLIQFGLCVVSGLAITLFHCSLHRRTVFAVLPFLGAKLFLRCDTKTETLPIVLFHPVIVGNIPLNRHMLLGGASDIESFSKGDIFAKETIFSHRTSAKGPNSMLDPLAVFVKTSKAYAPHNILRLAVARVSKDYSDKSITSRSLQFNTWLQNGCLCRLEDISGQFQRVCRYTGCTYSSISSLLRFYPLLLGEVSIVPGDDNQQDCTRSFNIPRPMRWVIFIICHLGAVLSAIASFLILISFDRWRRRSLGWGLLRCIAIPACIFISWHLIWYAL